MIFLGDYHTHTKASDGKGTVLDNILSAVEQGLEEVAIADHSFATVACKMTRDKFLEQEREIAKYYESTPNPIKVLGSVEGNILGFGGDIDIPDDIIERLDILHIGFHRFLNLEFAIKNREFVFVNGFGSNHSKERLKELNTGAYLKAMDKYPVDVIVHPGHRCPIDMESICKKAVEKDVYIELNEKHVETLEKDVKIILDSGVKLIVGSDAHKPEKVGKFGRVAGFIAKYDIPADRIYGLGQKPVFKNKKKGK